MAKAKKEKKENKDEFEFTNEEVDVNQSLKNKLTVARQILKNIQSNTEQLSSLLGDDGDDPAVNLIIDSGVIESSEEGGRVIEGVFDGQNMIGPDGKQYTVPSNYASKSKLVEGDILKLAISKAGSFVYKQIGPIERSRVIGMLAIDDETREYFVTSNNRRYKVLPASVTYYKGAPGDEIVVLVPKNSDSSWAAVENIIRKNL